MPIDFMFRMICSCDSSKAKKRHFSFLLQDASANEAAMLVFPVPAVPETSMLEPRKTPLPSSSISSRVGIPDVSFCEETEYVRSREVIGKTERPSWSIRNGYSLVPCVVPRYFAMRNN